MAGSLFDSDFAGTHARQCWGIDDVFGGFPLDSASVEG